MNFHQTRTSKAVDILPGIGCIVDHYSDTAIRTILNPFPAGITVTSTVLVAMETRYFNRVC